MEITQKIKHKYSPVVRTEQKTMKVKTIYCDWDYIIAK